MRLLDPLPETAEPDVAIPGDTPLDQVEAAAEGANRLTIRFSAFRDGRGFSLASILRERGYGGELVAEGDLLPDQVRHLKRSGFDAVRLNPGADPAEWRAMLAVIDTVYQPAADAGVPVWRRRAAPAAAQHETLEQKAARLDARHRDSDPETILKAAHREFPGRIAQLSSFGAEAAVGLDVLSRVDAATPVLFLDTGQHFLQTLSYRDQLTERLGLTNVKIVLPDAAERAAQDPRDDLWRTDADACCDLRKVRPLARAAAGYDAVITGRKRYQAATRERLAVFEVLDGQVRVNPLANLDADDIRELFETRDLPVHPLTEQGYASIGCWPCTRAVQSGEDARAGRWAGREKVECGIHLGSRAA